MVARHGSTRLWSWATQEAEALGGQVQGLPGQLTKILSKKYNVQTHYHRVVVKYLPSMKKPMVQLSDHFLSQKGKGRRKAER